MKWFLIQSLGLALLAFGLGALFHRLLWRKTVGVTSSSDVDVRRFGSSPSSNSASSPASSASSAQPNGALAGSGAGAAELSACRATVADLEAQLAASAKAHDQALAAARSEAEGRISALAAEHNATMDRMAAEHKAQIQGFAGSHESLVADTDATHAADISRLRDELDARHAELERQHTDLQQRHADLEVRHHALQSLMAQSAASVDPGSDAAFEGPDVEADDLTRVEGIGPKINSILLAGGVRTFRRLAAMSEEQLKTIVTAGGVSFAPSTGTWAAQAAFLRDGDEAGFQALADRLVGGRDEGQ